MLNPLVTVGEVLALVVLAMGLVGFLQFYARTRYRPHLAMLPSVVLVVGSTFFLFSAYTSGDSSRVVLFLLIQSIALPFFIYWGEQNRRSMEQIATTGDFDPGFPLPSENYVTISFFGQIYEDIAKPVVALEGEGKLNQLLQNLSNNHPVLTLAHFTEKGEFRLDQETVLKLGRTTLDMEGFKELLEALIQHFAKTGDIGSRNDLSEALRAKCGNTVSKYLDFLIDERLLHSLAEGVFTDKISTGIIEVDKALEGGLPKGVVVLLLTSQGQERKNLAHAFIHTGLDQGESCLVVSATRSPEQIRSDLRTSKPGQLTIVDCYTARLREIPTLEIQEDTIISPVALSVVDIAIARGLESLKSSKKRALVDILSTYIMVSSIEKVIPHLLEMIDQFRRKNCSAIFLFNPSLEEDEGGRFVLEELFDCVISTREEEKLILDFEKLNFQIDPSMEGMIRRGIRVNQEPGTIIPAAP